MFASYQPVAGDSAQNDVAGGGVPSQPVLDVVWQPSTPDLTQCRSLWLNSLELRVNQRDSSLISIANELSQVIWSDANDDGDSLLML